MLTPTHRAILAVMDNGCWWSADRIHPHLPKDLGITVGVVTMALVEIGVMRTRGYRITMAKTSTKSGVKANIIWRIVYADENKKPTFFRVGG